MNDKGSLLQIGLGDLAVPEVADVLERLVRPKVPDAAIKHPHLVLQSAQLLQHTRTAVKTTISHEHIWDAVIYALASVFPVAAVLVSC